MNGEEEQVKLNVDRGAMSGTANEQPDHHALDARFVISTGEILPLAARKRGSSGKSFPD